MGGPTGSALWHLTPECLATFRTLYGITYTRIRLDGPEDYEAHCPRDLQIQRKLGICTHDPARKNPAPHLASVFG